MSEIFYALRNTQDYWVGIWNLKDVAEKMNNKQPESGEIIELVRKTEYEICEEEIALANENYTAALAEITRLEAELQAARNNAMEEAANLAKEVEQSLCVAPRYRGWISKKVRALKDNE